MPALPFFSSDIDNDIILDWGKPVKG